MLSAPRTFAQKLCFVVSLICTSVTIILCVAAFVISLGSYTSFNIGVFLSITAFFTEIPAFILGFFTGSRPRAFRIIYRVVCIVCLAAALLLWFGFGSALTYGWSSLWG